MTLIDSFSGQYFFLSNFYISPCEYEGVVYPTSEHAYQAAKTTNLDYRLIVKGLSTPGKAKRAGRHLVLRPYWDDIKLQIMYLCVKSKFNYSGTLQGFLFNTENAELVEGNRHGDDFWGCIKDENGYWTGLNHLGYILMLLRSEINLKGFV